MKTKNTTIAAVLILIALLIMGYDELESHMAKDKALAICNDIKLDSDVAAIQKVMDSWGIPQLTAHPSLNELVRQAHYSFPSPDLVVASIPAAFAERWVCGARLNNGKVVKKEVRAVS